MSDSPNTTWHVALLCGGAGRRMGGPKGLLADGQGQLLASKVLSQVPEFMNKIILLSGRVHKEILPSLKQQTPETWSWTNLADDDNLDGPLAGLSSLVGHLKENQGVLVLAVDMPRVSRTLLEALLAKSSGKAMALKDKNGRCHPFPLVLPPKAVSALDLWARFNPKKGPVSFIEEHGTWVSGDSLNLAAGQLDDLDNPEQYQTWLAQEAASKKTNEGQPDASTPE